MIYTFGNFRLKVNKVNSGFLFSDLEGKAIKYYRNIDNINDKDIVEYLFDNDYSISFRNLIENHFKTKN